MPSWIKYVLMFVGGALAGSGVAYKLTKDKYEKILDNEIAAAKDFYAEIAEKNNENEVPEPKEEAKEPQKKNFSANLIPEEAIAGSREIAEKEGYTNYGSISTPKSLRQRKEESSRIYRIDRRTYDEDYEDYSHTDLIYYQDEDILTDDRDIVVENRDILLGKGNLNYFGSEDMDEPDCLLVRNELLKIDYEITLSQISYSEAIGDDDE